MKHNGEFSYDLLLGQRGEGLLADILKLNGDKIEVKTDYKATRTGNLFIEYENRGKASGLATSRADYWAFIISNEQIIIVETNKLKTLCRDNNLSRVNGGDSNTSKGVLLPLINIIK
mgnify:FL=1